jgi:hypothetical protein
VPSARLFLALVALVLGTGNVRADDKKEDPNVAALKAALEAQTREFEALRKRVEELEKERTKLVGEKEAVLRELLRVQNNEKLARIIADDYAKKIEALTARVRELRGPNERRAPEAPPPRPRAKAALPADLRGAVIRVELDLLQLNIGRDAGLEPGTVLEVIRTDGKNESRLGTVTITKTLFPKEAVGAFTPARKVPFKDLAPEELPRKGDTVRSPTP